MGYKEEEAEIGWESLQTMIQVWHLWKERGKKEGLIRKSPSL